MGVLTGARTLGRHGVSAVLEALLIVAIGVALVLGLAVATGRDPGGATGAFAARGGADIWIDASSLRTSDELSYGQEVAFGYRSDAAQSIQLHCYQPVGSDNLVFADSRMLDGDGSGVSDPFTLGPSGAWDGGSATCDAMLGHRTKGGRYRVEAEVRFTVKP